MTIWQKETRDGLMVLACFTPWHSRFPDLHDISTNWLLWQLDSSGTYCPRRKAKNSACNGCLCTWRIVPLDVKWKASGYGRIAFRLRHDHLSLACAPNWKLKLKLQDVLSWGVLFRAFGGNLPRAIMLKRWILGNDGSHLPSKGKNKRWKKKTHWSK